VEESNEKLFFVIGFVGLVNASDNTIICKVDDLLFSVEKTKKGFFFVSECQAIQGVCTLNEPEVSVTFQDEGGYALRYVAKRGLPIVRQRFFLKTKVFKNDQVKIAKIGDITKDDVDCEVDQPFVGCLETFEKVAYELKEK